MPELGKQVEAHIYCRCFVKALLSSKAVTEYMKRNGSTLTLSECKLLGVVLEDAEYSMEFNRTAYHQYYNTWDADLCRETDNPFFNE